jgi:hypothetical protein
MHVDIFIHIAHFHVHTYRQTYMYTPAWNPKPQTPSSPETQSLTSTFSYIHTYIQSGIHTCTHLHGIQSHRHLFLQRLNLSQAHFLLALQLPVLMHKLPDALLLGTRLEDFVCICMHVCMYVYACMHVFGVCSSCLF